MFTNRNFNDLYAFTQVVKLGNFNRAAQSLGVQPPALSHRMNDLENRLNTKLLNRTTRSMSPTEAGQRLYERIAPMFGGIQEELAALGDLRGKVLGRLRINTPENPAYYLIYPKIRSFLAQFPEVDVEILINNSWSDIVAQGFDFSVRPLGDVAATLRRGRRTRLRRTGGNLPQPTRRLSANGVVLPAQPPQNAGRDLCKKAFPSTAETPNTGFRLFPSPNTS
ncbi:LysR family transcriptional regulator [Haemophilus haemolyticus]|nr:LysR family transcriptional regulator [Haemophilus haemolyticus]